MKDFEKELDRIKTEVEEVMMEMALAYDEGEIGYKYFISSIQKAGLIGKDFEDATDAFIHYADVKKLLRLKNKSEIHDTEGKILVDSFIQAYKKMIN